MKRLAYFIKTVRQEEFVGLVKSNKIDTNRKENAK